MSGELAAAADAGELAELVAARVAERLGGAMIPATIPAEFAKQIAEAATAGWTRHSAFIPLGPWGMRVDVELLAGGRLSLQLSDLYGSPAWRGTFAPAD